MKRYQMLIGGEWVDAEGGATFESENPFLGGPWALVPKATPADVDRAVEAAFDAFRAPDWRRISASARGAILRRLGDVVTREADRLAELETRDNGKLIAEMRAQLRYLPQWFYYFGGLADKIEGRVIPIDKPGVFNFTRQEPIGVVAAITPWNSPLLLAAWKLAPALAAGNTVVWKPSEFSSVSALEFGELIEKAGIPRGVINIVTGFGNEVGEPLVTHPGVGKVAFTGGDRTGQGVYELAARSIKPVTLELGGKSANIVFEDAVLDNAVKGVVSGIFAATGQTCIAGSRALVHRSIHDVFVERLLQLAKSARIGDPLDDKTQVGPITTRPQYKKVLEYIEIARKEGASCLLGGAPARRPECGQGWFVEPTIFASVKPEMRIAQEEVFGPVLSIIPFEDDDEAVRINTYRAISYMSPFGGYKRSGLGRENGASAIREYLREKSVWIDTSGQVPNPFVMR